LPDTVVEGLNGGTPADARGAVAAMVAVAAARLGVAVTVTADGIAWR
jgi:hypothetical protein